MVSEWPLIVDRDEALIKKENNAQLRFKRLNNLGSYWRLLKSQKNKYPQDVFNLCQNIIFIIGHILW